MTGSVDDPEDGNAVAGSIFAAVGVYGVCLLVLLLLLLHIFSLHPSSHNQNDTDGITAVFSILRFSSIFTRTGE